MDPRTEELRSAHDVIADFYVDYLDGALERDPIERALLDLFSELTLAFSPAGAVADVGCGTGRLLPYLAARGLHPRGTDLSPRMIEVCKRDYPDFDFVEADLRDLPYADATLDGVVCWWSLIYLPPESRERAFSELARVVRPGGYLVTVFKDSDGQHRRSTNAAGLGVYYDTFWLSADEMQERFAAAGFATVFYGGRPVPAEARDGDPKIGYLLVRRVTD